MILILKTNNLQIRIPNLKILHPIRLPCMKNLSNLSQNWDLANIVKYQDLVAALYKEVVADSHTFRK